MKKIVLLMTLFTVFGVFAYANQNKGAKEITMFGGKRGEVPFTHAKHQERLGDCNVCHSLFPQSTGAVEALKKKGDLKKKHVMNKLCVKCHRTEQKAGKPYGPVACSKCHVKK